MTAAVYISTRFFFVTVPTMNESEVIPSAMRSDVFGKHSGVVFCCVAVSCVMV